MKYVYYEAATGQVMAEFNTPNLSVQKSWHDKGYLRALVPEGMRVTRDHKILSLIEVDEERFVETVEESINPVQPRPRVPTEAEVERARNRANGRAKLRALGLTDEEIGAL